MSLSDLDPVYARPGRVDCACGPEASAGKADIDAWKLSLAFGLAVLAQALLLATLPIVGAMLAPRRSLANLPYALTLLGAAFASVPASLLLDQFGRRAAFGLGASLGTAGGLLAGWAILSHNFVELCVGALWLGFAQGFALFYRHAAADRGGSAGALKVFAGGILASLSVPLAISLSQTVAGPLAAAVLPVIAGMASLAALPWLISLPHRFADQPAAAKPTPLRASFWTAAGVNGCAWFAMAHAMAGAPSALIACGLGAAVAGGLVSWHLLAMYAPMAFAARWRDTVSAGTVILAGAALLVPSMLLRPADAAMIETLLILAGTGWALCQIGTSRLLYDGARPSRLALGLHDGIVLGAALFGVLSAAS